MKAHWNPTGNVRLFYDKCKYKLRLQKRTNKKKKEKKFLCFLLVNLQYTDLTGTTQMLQLNISFRVLLDWTAGYRPEM